MSKIDLKDKRILLALSENSRQSLSGLAKEVGLSKNAVAYRVKRLRKAGVIHKFLPVTNFPKIGLTTYEIFVKLNVPPEEESEVLRELAQHEATIWLAKLSGKWDLFWEVVITHSMHFEDIIQDIMNKVGDKIQQYEAHIIYRAYKLSRISEDFLGELSTPKTPPLVPGRLALDDTDRKILFSLGADGSKSIKQLSDETNFSAETVRFRLKRLLKTGVIKKHSIDIDHQKLGYTQYVVRLELRNPLTEELEKLRMHLTESKQVIYAFRSANRMEIICFVVVRTPKEVDSFLRTVQNRHFSIIQKQETMLFSETLRLNLFPKVLSKGISQG